MRDTDPGDSGEARAAHGEPLPARDVARGLLVVAGILMVVAAPVVLAVGLEVLPRHGDGIGVIRRGHDPRGPRRAGRARCRGRRRRPGPPGRWTGRVVPSVLTSIAVEVLASSPFEDVATTGAEMDENARPETELPSETAAAGAAAEALAATLQRGLDGADADAYDESFGADVLWGNPRGGIVEGFAELNAIHHELMARGVAPPSRFEVVAVRAPAPGVAVAHIRRRALDPGGFSEAALYVLVRRGDRWWLVAAQNTPVTG